MRQGWWQVLTVTCLRACQSLLSPVRAPTPRGPNCPGVPDPSWDHHTLARCCYISPLLHFYCFSFCFKLYFCSVLFISPPEFCCFCFDGGATLGSGIPTPSVVLHFVTSDRARPFLDGVDESLALFLGRPRQFWRWREVDADFRHTLPTDILFHPWRHCLHSLPPAHQCSSVVGTYWCSGGHKSPPPLGTESLARHGVGTIMNCGP